MEERFAEPAGRRAFLDKVAVETRAVAFFFIGVDFFSGVAFFTGSEVRFSFYFCQDVCFHFCVVFVETLPGLIPHS